LGKGAALEDIPPPLAGEIAQPGQTVKGEPPKTAGGRPPDRPLPAPGADVQGRAAENGGALHP